MSGEVKILSEPMVGWESVAVGLWVRTGSRHESEERHGLSHVLEHMAFKGTEKRSAARIVEEIEGVGGMINAATGLETTAYYVRVLREHLPLAVDVLTDIVFGSVFDERELELERGVVLQELAQALDTPGDKVFDMLSEVAWQGQSIGRSILGTRASVEAIGREMIQEHVETYYRGGAMVLAASGGVEPEAFEKLARASCVGARGGAARGFAPARWDGGVAWQEDKHLEQAHVVMGLEGVGSHHKQRAVQSVAAHILGGGMASRLFRALREEKGLCYAVSAFGWRFSDTGMLGMYGACAPHHVDALAQGMVEEAVKLAEHVEEEELVRAKAAMRAGMVMGMEKVSLRAERLASDWLTYGEVREPRAVLEEVARVEAADVKAFVAGVLGGSRLALAGVGGKGGDRVYEGLMGRLG